MISDISTYDTYPLRKKRETILVLSFDESFKQKVRDKNPNKILIGFAEESLDEVKDFSEYFKFFMTVMSELDTVIIDCNFYSIAISLIHSSAVNEKNVKRIILYVDESISENFSIYSKDPTLPPAPVQKKEESYSRQKFFNG